MPPGQALCKQDARHQPLFVSQDSVISFSSVDRCFLLPKMYFKRQNDKAEEGKESLGEPCGSFSSLSLLAPATGAAVLFMAWNLSRSSVAIKNKLN